VRHNKGIKRTPKRGRLNADAELDNFGHSNAGIGKGAAISGAAYA